MKTDPQKDNSIKSTGRSSFFLPENLRITLDWLRLEAGC
jgi:hypothetical protein